MRNYTEQEMRDILGQEMQPSQIVEDSLSRAYRQIRATKKRRFHLWQGATGTAAAVFAAGVFCVSNPALAAKLPFVGHIFEELGNEASYGGDYSGVGTQLAAGESEKAAGAEGTKQEVAAQESVGNYVQTSDGMTMTLSEVYCNDLALYFTMELKADEPIADHFTMYDGDPHLQIAGTAKYSFKDGEESVLEALDGKFADEYTYLALYRMELSSALTDDSEYQAAIKEAYGEEGPENDAEAAAYMDLIKKIDLPENFDVTLSFDHIYGERKDPVSIYEAAGVEKPSEETLLAMSDEEWNAHMQELFEKVPDYNNVPNQYENFAYEGPYTFEVPVQVDHERTVTVQVENDAESECYVSSVTRTPFELCLDMHTNPENDLYPTLVVLDANGKLMDTGKRGGAENMLAVDGHDVSRVDIYYVSWEDFETKQIKGTYFEKNGTNAEGQTLKDVLDACSIYHKEVTLG